MEIIICPRAEDAAQMAATRIARELAARPAMTLGLATGRTMESVYEQLVAYGLQARLDFSQCHTFNLDEYVGLPSSDPNSYHYFMHHRLFSRVNASSQHCHLPDGMAPDLERECARYEQLIEDCGGIDLQLLGIGLNGHLGFNEPPCPFDSQTRVEVLSPITRRQNASLFSRPDKVPVRAITMGMGRIMAARHCLLLATGKEKAEIVAQAIEGPVTERVTASALQYHLSCTVILDEAAAIRIRRRPAAVAGA